jgi:methyl-accepting chemotaxis protein
MNQQPTIDDIQRACDTAVAALTAAIERVDHEADQAAPGKLRDQLRKRSEDLTDECQAILAATNEAILSLPEVIAAANQLEQLSRDMNATAQELPNVAHALDKASAILALGQQFSSVIAKASNG